MIYLVFDWIEWTGYLASLIVLISLLMSSVKKLRWISLVGSFVFGVYGILITSYPVAVMNFGIVLVNAYYLVQMYTTKDLFKMIPINDEAYLNHFMDVYQKDMKQYMDVKLGRDGEFIQFFVTRNTVPAGLFIGKKIEKGQLEILIDYTTPMFRDFKIASYIYDNEKSIFKDQGIHKLFAKPAHEKHNQYLEKIGFKLDQSKNIYIKEI